MANTWTTTRCLHSGFKRSGADLVTTITSISSFRGCLHGGGRPQAGEAIRLGGVTATCYLTWGLPTPCKQVFSGSLLDSYTMFAFWSVSPTKFHNGHPGGRKRPIQRSFPLKRGLTRVNVWLICPPRQGHSILYPHPLPPPLSPPSR